MAAQRGRLRRHRRGQRRRPRLVSLVWALIYGFFAYLTFKIIAGAGGGSQTSRQQDLAGVLVVEAAVTCKPAKAGGIDKALLTLRNQPFGEVLLGLAALGLVIFGIYGLCQARWRRV